MTEKRFILMEKWLDENSNLRVHVVLDNGKFWNNFMTQYDADKTCRKLNELNDENNELKEELRVYRQVANCGNCTYHNYDWYDDGDEFEVCEKGNDVSERICKDWEEL